MPGTPAAKSPMSAAPRFWLLKSEPSDYSISAMEAEGRTVGTACAICKLGSHARCGLDRCLFYHSS